MKKKANHRISFDVCPFIHQIDNDESITHLNELLSLLLIHI